MDPSDKTCKRLQQDPNWRRLKTTTSCLCDHFMCFHFCLVPFFSLYVSVVILCLFLVAWYLVVVIYSLCICFPYGHFTSLCWSLCLFVVVLCVFAVIWFHFLANLYFCGFFFFLSPFYVSVVILRLFVIVLCLFVVALCLFVAVLSFCTCFASLL